MLSHLGSLVVILAYSVIDESIVYCYKPMASSAISYAFECVGSP